MHFSPLTLQSLYPVRAIRSVGGFNPKVERGQEHELNVRLYLSGFDFVYMADLCGWYRVHQAPTRISIAHRTRSYFHDIENFGSLIKLVQNGSRKYESAENLKVLAEAAWRIGRERLRIGRADDARVFFPNLAN